MIRYVLQTPSIPSEHYLKVGQVMADEASVRTEFQSQILVGSKGAV